jgi:hypothetical protein
MKKETHKITDKTESYAQQLPLSVAHYVNNNDGSFADSGKALVWLVMKLLLTYGSICYSIMLNRYLRDKLLTMVV